MNDIRNKPLPPGENGPNTLNIPNSVHLPLGTPNAPPSGQAFLPTQLSVGSGALGSLGGSNQPTRIGNAAPPPSVVVSQTSDSGLPVSVNWCSMEALAVIFWPSESDGKNEVEVASKNTYADND